MEVNGKLKSWSITLLRHFHDDSAFVSQQHIACAPGKGRGLLFVGFPLDHKKSQRVPDARKRKG